MTLLLALAATAGVTFSCEAGPRTFKLFAPAPEVVAQQTADDTAGLYTFEGMPFGETAKVEQVLDGLPYELFLSVNDEFDSPIQIEINQLDETAMTARVAVTEDVTPTSARSTMISYRGNCMFSREGGEGEP